MNKDDDEVVINRINLGTGDGRARSNLEGFGRDSKCLHYLEVYYMIFGYELVNVEFLN